MKIIITAQVGDYDDIDETDASGLEPAAYERLNEALTDAGLDDVEIRRADS